MARSLQLKDTVKAYCHRKKGLWFLTPISTLFHQLLYVVTRDLFSKCRSIHTILRVPDVEQKLHTLQEFIPVLIVGFVLLDV